MPTTSLMPEPRQRYFNNNGSVAAGCLLYTYAAGTSTPKATYTDSAGTTPHANPVVLDSKGEAVIYWSGNYKIDLKTAAGVQITGYPVDNYAYSATATDTLRADLAASSGAGLMGTISIGAGSIATTVEKKLREHPSPQDRGAIVDGSANDYAALQNLATDGDVELTSGTLKIKTGISFTQPIAFRGRGAKSIINVASDFVAAGDVFTVSPAAGTEKRNWEFKEFQVTNSGTAANNVFQLDIAAAGKFLNKLSIKNVIADAVIGKFVELLNPTNVDGLFSSVFEDNWSLNGYYLDNVGDSVICQRNTVSGTGVSYYINQLGTASHMLIKDCNLTSAGGALHAVKSMNLRFDDNQVECTGVFSGSNNAAVSFNSLTAAASHQNPKVTNNNINTQSNATLRCVYAEWTNGLVIEGNTLFCDPATGVHIYLDANANDSYIGFNKYYSSTTGAEINPIITDSGIGTAGIWKDATITLAGWSSQNTANEHPLGFFKDRDGNVQLRGRVAGAAATAGDTLFTLPVGFRPKTKGYLVGTYGANGAAIATVLQILPGGQVQILATGTTGVYAAGVVFSTK